LARDSRHDKMQLSTCVVLALCGLLAPASAQTLNRLGQLSISKPSTLGWWIDAANPNPLNRYTLLSDSYSAIPATFDQSYAFREVGRYMGNINSLPRLQIAGSLNIPKNIAQTPFNVFGMHGVTIIDGADIAVKYRGSVYAINVTDWSSTSKHDIAGNILLNEKISYFGAVFVHANNDLAHDVFGCSVDYTSNPIRSEFKILLQPLILPLTRRWEEHSLYNQSCDSGLASVELTAQVGPVRRTFDVIFTIGALSREIVVYWSTSNVFNWLDPALVERRVIATGRPWHDIQIVDINGGLPEILVTFKDTANGGFEVIEIPEDFRTGTYTEHLIASGMSSGGSGTPGTIRAFHPITPTSPDQKKWFVISGADRGSATYYDPVSADADDWRYIPHDIPVNSGFNGKVEGVEAADVDGDGRTELFVSVHSRDEIQVYRFN